MRYIDTPAGKFQIFRNGIPIEFECHLDCEYAYFDENNMPITRLINNKRLILQF